MQFSEKILRVFEHKSIDKTIWQPRIGYWFNNYCVRTNNENYDQMKQHVPKRYIGYDMTEVYDYLNASFRYPGAVLGIGLFNTVNTQDAEVKFESHKLEDESQLRKTITPVGELTETSKNGYTHDHLVKKIEDLKVIKYLVEHRELTFNEPGFNLAREIMNEDGDYGEPTAYYFRSPYQSCVLNYLGFNKTVIFLRKYPREMEDFMKFLGDWDRKQYENVICPSPLKWVNFGENIDQHLSPPHYFEKYLMEYYHDRCKLLKRAGKYTFIHVDGSFKDLLPLLPEIPHDGIEALTPPPQGDVTVKEMARTFNDTGKILVDILPATLFMTQFEPYKLEQKVKEIIDELSPNLIMGISDELCMGDGGRLKLVSEAIEKYHKR